MHVKTQAHHPTTAASPPENYERYFVPVIGRPLASALVDRAGLRPGENVLDVACGTGIVTRLAADAVSPGGSVAALDMNPGMLAVARATVQPSDSTIRWYETSAESIPLPDAEFDVVFCQLALQFMADQQAALSEMHRVLKPRGRALLNTPRPGPFFQIMEDAFEQHASREAAAFVGSVFSLNDPQHFQELVRNAGFDDIDVRVDTRTFHLPPARDFLWQYVMSTPIAPTLPRPGSPEAAGIEDHIVSQWKPWAVHNGMQYDQEIITVTARA